MKDGNNEYQMDVFKSKIVGAQTWYLINSDCVMWISQLLHFFKFF